jgi:ABC-type Fe3+-hydroxamate transport system substrate-binding protein
MKKNLIILLTVAAAMTAGCKKEKTETPEEPQQIVSGYYAGKINTNPASTEFLNNYGILFKPNGTARVYNLGNGTDTSLLLSLGSKMDGTWLQSGNNLQLSYKPIGSLITVSSTVNKSATEINGTWGFNGETKGKFYLNRN